MHLVWKGGGQYSLGKGKRLVSEGSGIGRQKSKGERSRVTPFCVFVRVCVCSDPKPDYLSMLRSDFSCHR